MKTARIDVASVRREQIIEAAVSVITEQGLQNLSLSEIEKKAGMSRGQLTYYFPTKEAILLAVFDRLVRLMNQQHEPQEGGPAACPKPERWQDAITYVLGMILQDTPLHPEFDVLVRQVPGMQVLARADIPFSREDAEADAFEVAEDGCAIYRSTGRA